MKGNLHVISKGSKGGRQEVQGVIVNKMKNDFVFNYNTAQDPAPEEIELLRDFRNLFIDELVKLNNVLGHIPEQNMTYPADEETFDTRTSPEWIRQGHLNSVQQFLKRIQDFLGYGGRLHDETGLVMPVGAIMAYPGVTAPSGWLLCDGSRYLRAGSDYADLFAVIGTKYGAWGPDHFNVPDLRGCFLRGYSKIPSISFEPDDVSVGVDTIVLIGQKFNRSAFPVRFTTDGTLPAPFVINTTYYIVHIGGDNLRIAASRADALTLTFIDITTTGAGTSYCHPYVEEDKDSRLKLTYGGNDGEDLGSYQEDELKTHRHYTNLDRGIAGTAYGYFGFANNLAWDEDYYSSYEGGVESRPRNVNVNYIIKR